MHVVVGNKILLFIWLVILMIRIFLSLSTRWSIKGIVTNKTNTHHYKNARGEGIVFSFDLLDSTAEIRITAFNDQCSRLHPVIQIGQVGITNYKLVLISSED